MPALKKAVLPLLAALALCVTPASADGGLFHAGQVTAQALGQMGFTEEDDEFTPFGQRYGYPNGYWYDMFASWCADEAGGASSRPFSGSTASSAGGTACPRQSMVFYRHDRPLRRTSA